MFITSLTRLSGHGDLWALTTDDLLPRLTQPTSPTMIGEISLFVTSVTNAGSHISFHAQLDPEKFAKLDFFISQHQALFEQVGTPSHDEGAEV